MKAQVVFRKKADRLTMKAGVTETQLCHMVGELYTTLHGNVSFLSSLTILAPLCF